MDKLKDGKFSRYTLYCITICLVAIISYCAIMLMQKSNDNTNGLIQITRADIDDLIASSDESIIYFAKDECDSCELNIPLLEQLSENYNKHIYVYDASQDLLNDHYSTVSFIREFGLSQAPSILISKSGIILHRFEGNIAEPLRDYLVSASDSPSYPYTQISLYELTSFLNSNGEYVLAFLRDDCQKCESFIPVLTDLINRYDLQVYAYNTSSDRETRYDDMMDVMNLYGVSSVPSIVIMKDGTITEQFSGEAISEQFSDYLSSFAHD